MTPNPTPSEPLPPLAPEQGLEGEALRRLATSGAMLVALRGIAIRVIGLGGYLVLARILAPADFGVAALGLSITYFGHFLADAGIGPALLRAPEAPNRSLLAAVVGLQLAVTTVVVAGVGVAAVALESKPAAVATIFLASLPFLAMRVPATIALERRLEYRPLMTAEISEVLTFNVVAIVAVLLGAGVYGLAVASIVKTLVGWIVLVRLAPGHSVLPRFRLQPLRGLLGFGVLFQASSAVSMGRDFLWSLGISFMGGFAMLGQWSVVYRLIGVPLLVFESLFRVSFPAMARLIESGEDPRGAVERGLSVAAITTGLLLAPVAAGGADALTAVLGSQWHEAGRILPLVCLGLLATLPISVVATGYLYARGEARTMLTINLALSGTMLAAGAALLPLTGYIGLGLAWMLASGVDGVLLSRALHSRLGLSPAAALVKPLVACVAGYGAGAATARAADPELLAGVGGGLVAGATYVACMWLLDRAAVQTTCRLLAGALRRTRN